ncbi:MAG TPA: hypothetical protein DCG75_13845 [Bacteroidales bacterium]|nr:hypothetical protein [Bacteroidales bacterium]
MLKTAVKHKVHYLIIPLLLVFFLYVFSLIFIFLPSVERSIIDKKKEMIKELTNTVWTLMDFYNKRVEDKLISIDDAKALVLHNVEIMRYGKEKKDYFWINDFRPYMIMHPYLPELDNHNLSAYTDPDGTFLFNEMVEIVLRNGEGYVNYKWQLKDDSLQILPKISFVKGFKPWGWIIGTGVYINDIEQEIASMKKNLVLVSIVITVFVLLLFIYILNRGLKKEKHLRELETKYKKLFEEANDGILILKNNKIINCNNKVLELFKCKKLDIIDKTIADFSPDYQDDGEKSVDKLEKIINECMKGIPQFFEWDHITKNGELFITEISLSNIEIENEIYINSFIRDITQRKKVEKKLIEAVEKAENADKLKSAFLANMSHEIRTPMNGILGFSQLLKKENLPKNQKDEFVNIINSKGNQLLQIINDIIDISKIESNQIKIYYSEFSINKMIEEIYESFTTEPNQNFKSNIDFHIRKKLPDSKSVIKSDRTRIIQILYNLVNNAFKYSNQGKIEIGYKIKTSEVEFYVTDNGIGVKEEEKDFIFERFVQSDGSTRRLYGGTGLGLSISKGLVELLGGSIGVESDGISGSRFYFTIPYKFVSKSLKEHSSENLDNLNWSDKNILIVEDDHISFEFLKELLSETKINISHAETGEIALQESKSKSFNLILMDIQLPDIDGYATTKLIRKINPDIPIIAQTANAFVEDREKSIIAGCNDYISKPINRKLLLRIINHYI